MNKFKKFISSQFFSDNHAVNFFGLIILCFLGYFIIFQIYHTFKIFKFPSKPLIDKNKQNDNIVSDKKQIIDAVVMEQPKYYICNYCGSKYRYFQTNCDNCGANHIDFIKK